MKKSNRLSRKFIRTFSGVLGLFVFLVFLLPTAQVYAYENSVTIEKLSLMSEKDCLDMLLRNGLRLPEVYKNNDYTARAVKTIVDDINKGITDIEHIPYNYTELAELAKRIINVYAKNTSTLASYTLKDSTVIGSWSNSYTGYNCYGYSIGVHVFENPGYHSNQRFSMGLSIARMADLVIDDLDAIGYWGYKTTNKPTSLANFEKVICIRKGDIDYHFMRGNRTGDNWNHKPGGTNPLNWNYASPGYKTWTNEHSYKNVSYEGDTTYNSSIYYIIYWIKDGPGPQPYTIN